MAEQALTEFASVLTGDKPDPEPAPEEDKPAAGQPSGAEPEEAPDSEAGGGPELPQIESEDPGEGHGESFSVKELADKLELSPEDLYKGVKLDLNGSEVSLGEIKDRAKDLLRSDELLAGAREQKLAGENEVLKLNRALQLAMQKLGRPMTEADIKEAEEAFKQYGAQEDAKLLAALPGWKDPDVQRKGLNLLASTASEYGLSDAEILAMKDARYRKAFFDLGRLRQQLKSAAAAEVKGKTPPKSRSQRKAAPNQPRDLKQAYEAGKVSQEGAVLGLIAAGADKHGEYES